MAVNWWFLIINILSGFLPRWWVLFRKKGFHWIQIVSWRKACNTWWHVPSFTRSFADLLRCTHSRCEPPELSLIWNICETVVFVVLFLLMDKASILKSRWSHLVCPRVPQWRTTLTSSEHGYPCVFIRPMFINIPVRALIMNPSCIVCLVILFIISCQTPTYFILLLLLFMIILFWCIK